jgi:hypothetical protein
MPKMSACSFLRTFVFELEGFGSILDGTSVDRPKSDKQGGALTRLDNGLLRDFSALRDGQCRTPHA